MTKMSQKSKLIIINECYNDISSIVVRCYPAYLKASNCGSAVPRDKSPAGGKKKEKEGVKKKGVKKLKITPFYYVSSMVPNGVSPPIIIKIFENSHPR